jgi:hypothetical protein
MDFLIFQFLICGFQYCFAHWVGRSENDFRGRLGGLLFLFFIVLLDFFLWLVLWQWGRRLRG